MPPAHSMAEPSEPAAPDVVRLNNKWDPSEVKRVLDECASQVRSLARRMRATCALRWLACRPCWTRVTRKTCSSATPRLVRPLALPCGAPCAPHALHFTQGLGC